MRISQINARGRKKFLSAINLIYGHESNRMNNFPISVSEIAEGMKNASSALAAAGNSFDQSVALLTAANTTINLCRVA